MSRGVKITLVVVAIVLVLCCISGVSIYIIARQTANQAFTVDSAQAAKIGHEIVDYTLPPGYREEGAMNAFVFKMVMIGSSSYSTNAMMFMLMQYPFGSNVSQEEMERQMRQAWAQQSQRSYAQMKVVGTQKATIRGQAVTLIVSEGGVSDNQTMRQVMGFFSGKGGMAAVMATGLKETWDQAAMDSFLASMK